MVTVTLLVLLCVGSGLIVGLLIIPALVVSGHISAAERRREDALTSGRQRSDGALWRATLSDGDGDG